MVISQSWSISLKTGRWYPQLPLLQEIRKWSLEQALISILLIATEMLHQCHVRLTCSSMWYTFSFLQFSLIPCIRVLNVLVSLLSVCLVSACFAFDSHCYTWSIFWQASKPTLYDTSKTIPLVLGSLSYINVNGCWISYPFCWTEMSMAAHLCTSLRALDQWNACGSFWLGVLSGMFEMFMGMLQPFCVASLTAHTLILAVLSCLCCSLRSIAIYVSQYSDIAIISRF